MNFCSTFFAPLSIVGCAFSISFCSWKASMRARGLPPHAFASAFASPLSILPSFRLQAALHGDRQRQLGSAAGDLAQQVDHLEAAQLEPLGLGDGEPAGAQRVLVGQRLGLELAFGPRANAVAPPRGDAALAGVPAV